MAWCLWVFLFIFYSLLFFFRKFNAKEYIFILCFNTFFLFALLAFPRLKEFDAMSLSMKLDQFHQDSREILAKEKDLRGIAQYLLDIDGLIALEEGRMGSEEGYNLRREWVKVKLSELKKRINLDTTRLDEYQKLFTEFDSYADDASNAGNPRFKEASKKCEEITSKIDQMMRQDIESAKNSQ